MTVVAAFDFDATLTRRDTVVPFLQRLAGRRSIAAGLLTRPHRVGPAAARRDRDALRAVATELVFRGRDVREVEAAAEDHAAAIVAAGLRDDTVGRLDWHRGAGHRVVVVTASYEVYAIRVGELLGVDVVLGTRLEVRDRRCTGHLDGPNCRGPEKVRRLAAWLADEGLSLDTVTLWAYGDSSGDRELLGVADHPHWVRDPLASVTPDV